MRPHAPRFHNYTLMNLGIWILEYSRAIREENILDNLIIQYIHEHYNLLI